MVFFAVARAVARRGMGRRDSPGPGRPGSPSIITPDPIHAARVAVIADHLLEILRCPQSRTRLHVADTDVVARLNRGINARTIVNLAGERVERPVDGGLIREAGDLLYPIVDQIPVMLPDQAIDISRL